MTFAEEETNEKRKKKKPRNNLSKFPDHQNN